MTRPPSSLKGELNNALIGGIRQRGSEAVGLMLVSMVKLAVGTAALTALLILAAIFGFEMTATLLAGATTLAGLGRWLVGGAPAPPTSANRRR